MARSSKRLRQTGLAQNSVGGVAARDSNRHREISLGDRAMPNLVAALALPHHHAARGTQQVAQGSVELRRHLRRGGLCFTQRGDLQEQI
jgi:hypothetical protein